MCVRERESVCSVISQSFSLSNSVDGVVWFSVDIMVSCDKLKR